MKKACFSFLLLFSAIVSIAQKASPVKLADNKSLLWQVSRKDINKPSYIFGTMHLICAGDYIWTNKMRTSLQKSDEVCFEMNIADPNVMMQVALGMINQDGKSLKDYFTEEQYRKLMQYITDSLGMDIVMLQQLKPIALETMLTTKATSCSNPVSYEENILAEAKKLHKSIAGLETPAEQIQILNSIPIDSVIADLVEITTGKKTEDTTYNKLLNAYKQQDLPALYNLIRNSKESGLDMGTFLDDRNVKWIERITDKMEQKSVFFAVGAGHLWGDNGLINQLRQIGYDVVPVK